MSGRLINNTALVTAGKKYSFVFSSDRPLFLESTIRERLLAYPNFSSYSVSRDLSILDGGSIVTITFVWNGDDQQVSDVGAAIANTVSGSFFSYGSIQFAKAYEGDSPDIPKNPNPFDGLLTNKYILAGGVFALVIVFAWAFGQGAGEGVAAKV